MTFNAAAGATGPSGPPGSPEDIDSLPAASTPLARANVIVVSQSGTESAVAVQDVVPGWTVDADFNLKQAAISGQFTQIGEAVGGFYTIADASQTMFADVFGTNNLALFYGEKARGTIASPTAVHSGDPIVEFTGFGYGDTGFVYGSADPGLRMESAGTFTDTSAPVRLSLKTTPPLAVDAIERMSIEADGGITVPFAYATPTTGQTVTMAAGARRVVINPAGTLATLTVSLPPTPTNGQLAGFASTKIITALTVSAQSSKSVAGALTALAVGGSQNFVYRDADTTWYPAP